MNYYLITIIFLLLIGISFNKKDFFEDYIKKTQTTCINGIFILLVFYRHIAQYVVFDKKADFIMNTLNRGMGQLIVTSFLFYSGYGVMESIKRKGNVYTESMIPKRIFPTWIRFAAAVSLFFLLNLLLGIEMEKKNVLLSFFAWNSIGNSAWYIFIILCMYFFTWVVFSVFKEKKETALLALFILTAALFYCLFQVKEKYWYDTIFCYFTGAFYSMYKEQIEYWVQNKKLYYPIVIFFVIAFNLCIHYRTHIMIYEFYSISFCLLIVLLTMKIKIGNKILYWLGSNLFGLYILQRLPMIYLKKTGYADAHKYRYVVLCIIITLILNFLFKKAEVIVKKLFFHNNF